MVSRISAVNLVGHHRNLVEDVKKAIASMTSDQDKVSVAAVNGPKMTVVSGWKKDGDWGIGSFPGSN